MLPGFALASLGLGMAFFALGARGMAGVSLQTGRALLLVFVALSVISVVLCVAGARLPV